MAILTVQNISKSFDLKEILQSITFNVEKNDKIGLIGINGSGKTTLFKIIYDVIGPDSGSISYVNGLKIGYLRQSIEVDENKTIYEICLEKFKDVIDLKEDIKKLEEKISSEKDHVILNRLLREYQNKTEQFNKKEGYMYDSKIKGMLKGLNFTEDEFESLAKNLSGGEKSRLLLASILLENPDLLLLDEPTNHLDIEATMFLENFLRSYNKAFMVISHDRYFLDRVCKRFFTWKTKS